MRVLVTGGAGFIGSSLTRSLVREGHEVVVFDNLVSTCSLALVDDVLPRIAFVHGDVRSPEDFGKIPAGRFDRVYHLAASFANALSVEHPTIDLRTNGDGTANAVAFAKRIGCGLFVYAGSSSSYGDVDPPFREDGPSRPTTPYAASKALGERHVVASGVPSAVLRLFNVYGPGDLPGPWRNAIPNMMKCVVGGGTIPIYGDASTRDFTYVDDVVRLLLDADRARGEIVNVGTGEETSIVDLARRILRLFGADESRIRIEPPRPWDRVARRCADVTKLRSLFGVDPTATPLDVGLMRTATWLRERLHGAKR